MVVVLTCRVVEARNLFKLLIEEEQDSLAHDSYLLRFAKHLFGCYLHKSSNARKDCNNNPLFAAAMQCSCNKVTV